jgi:hypothetical protein
LVGKLKDRAGHVYGRLTAVSFAHREYYPGGTRVFWNCRCDCGTEKVLCGNKLSSRKYMSCGSCQKPGGNRSGWPGYSSLKGAIGRCYNPNNTAFSDYGGRGIGVCDRWRFGEGGLTGFECFSADMGPRPQGKTLDRIDVDGHYEPGNCRWASKPEQQQNQRRAIYAVIGGVNVPLKTYACRTGLNYESLRFRVRHHGETVTEAARSVLKHGLRPHRRRRLA